MESPAGTHRVVVEAADGRRLVAYVDPSPSGLPVVFHHGTPGSGRPLTVLVDGARRVGLRWVSLSRAGFGGSTRRVGRDVGSIAADTAAVLEHLGIDRCVVAGWSGGGPHALACGALLPGLVEAVLVIAGSAPYPADGLDWLAGMSEEDAAEAEAALRDPDELGRMVEPRRAWYLTATGEEWVRALEGRFSDDDIATVTPHAAEFVACIAEALAPGVEAWVDDWTALVRPWGFDLAEVSARTVLWHGDRDRSCPLSHAEWMQAHLPRARLHVRRGQGHLAVGLSDTREMFDALVSASGA